MATLRGLDRSYKQPRKFDSTRVEGKVNKYIDQRTAYVPTVEADKLSKKELLIENEMLRETLYAQQNTYQNIVLSHMYQAFGHSTSDVIKMAEQIESQTKGVLKPQDSFRMIYKAIEDHYKISFEIRKPNESKLQYGWRIGMLPIIAMYMHALNIMTYHTFRLDLQESIKFYSKLINKIKPKKAPKAIKVP